MTDTPAGKADYSFDAQIGDRRVRVDPTELTRKEWRLLREELGGVNQVEVMIRLTQVDLDVMAGCIWLVLRRENPDLKFDDIDISYSSILDSQEDEANPPA